jgi:hypothetical protein
MNKQIIIGLIAGAILTSSFVQADIVTDIRAGVSPQQVVQLALSNQLAPIQIVTQLITAGVNPIIGAVIVARAVPNEAINIAVAAVSAAQTTSCEKHSNCSDLVSQLAIEIADAVAEIVPDQREAIIYAVAKAAPETARVIANFYPDPTARAADPAFTQQEATITIPPPPSLSQTNNCVFRKDCNYRDPRFPDRKVFLCCVSPSR